MSKDLTLANAEAEAHRRASSAVRFLMARKGVSQQELANLLGCDKSGINRALLPVGANRQRWWRHGEIMAMAIIFEVDPALFYESDVHAAWQERLAPALAERQRQAGGD